MTTKKSVALIIVLMMVLSALAGCSSTKTNTPGEATKAPASVEGNAETSADKTPDGETSAEREHATFSLLNMSAATTTVDLGRTLPSASTWRRRPMSIWRSSIWSVPTSVRRLPCSSPPVNIPT